jgi:hypothetical protein
MEMWLGECIPGADPMYPSSTFIHFKMHGPHYIPFLSEVDTLWLILCCIHLLPDPRGGASTTIFNHHTTHHLNIIETLQQTSEHQHSDDDLSDHDLSDDDLRRGHPEQSATDSEDDAAAMDMASDMNYHDDDKDQDHEDSDSEYDHRDLEDDHDEDDDDDEVDDLLAAYPAASRRAINPVSPPPLSGAQSRTFFAHRAIPLFPAPAKTRICAVRVFQDVLAHNPALYSLIRSRSGTLFKNVMNFNFPT